MARSCPIKNQLAWRTMLSSFKREKAFKTHAYLINTYGEGYTNQKVAHTIFYDKLKDGTFVDQDIYNMLMLLDIINSRRAYGEFYTLPVGIEDTPLLGEYKASKGEYTNLTKLKMQELNKFNAYIKSKFNISFDLLNTTKLKNSIRVDVSPIALKELNSIKSRSTDYTFRPTNTKVSDKYKKVITQLENIQLPRLKAELSRARSEKNAVKVKVVEKRLENLEDKIKKLKESASLKVVLDIAREDLASVTEMLKQPYISKEDIIYSSRVILFWSNGELGNSILDEIDVETKSANFLAFEDIQKTANTLYNYDWLTALHNATIQIIEEQTGKSYSQWSDQEKKKLLTEFTDITKPGALLRDASTNSNIVVQIADRIIKEANVKTELEAEAVFSKYDKLEKEIKDAGFSLDYVYDLMKQRDASGKPTGNIVYRFSQAYFDAARKNRAYKKSTDNQKLEYRQWLRDNTLTFDFRKLFFDEYSNIYPNAQTFTPEQINEHREEIKKQVGADAYDFYMQKAKEVFDRFMEDYQIIKEDVEEQYEGDMASQLTELETWLKKYSPFNYQNMLEGSVKYDLNNLIAFRGKQYLVTVPRRYDLKNKETKWYDSNFDKIQSNPTLLKFYNTVMDDLNTFMSYYPSYVTDELQVNYLPEMAKGMFESTAWYNVGEVSKKLYSRMLESVSSPEFFQGLQTKTNPLTGKPEPKLPVFMMSNVLKPEEKSFNIIQVMKATAMTSLAYKHKAQAEDSVRIVDNVINQAKELKLDNKGNPLLDASGDLLTTKGDLKNTREQWEYALNTFYGLRKDDTTSRLKIKSKQKELDNLDLEIKKIKESVKKGETEKADGDRQIATIEGRKVELSKEERYLSYTKIGDGFLKFVHMKALGWNIFSMFNNLGFGVISNLNHATGGEDFKGSTYLKSLLMVTNVATGFRHATNLTSEEIRHTSDKIRNLIGKYNFLSEVNEVNYNSHASNSKLSKGLKKLSPYELTKRAEYINQGSMFIAMLMDTMVDLGNGTKMSMYEIYDSEGNIRESLKDAQKLTDEQFNELKEKYEGTGFEKMKFKLKAEQLKKQIHGNYDPNSPVAIKKNILGRAVLMFRSWIAEGFSARFEEERFDTLLDRQVKGRYRTIGQLIMKDNFKVFARLATAYGSEYNADLSEVDRANVRKSMTDILSTLSILVLLTALKGMKDGLDDDKEKNAASLATLNFLVNHYNRMYDDVMFYVSPNSAGDILREPIPARKMFKDMSEFVDASIRYFFDDDIITKGPYRGDSRLKRESLQLIPFTSQYYSLKSLIERDMSMDSKSVTDYIKEYIVPEPKGKKRGKRKKYPELEAQERRKKERQSEAYRQSY